jgi:hypothetical protein
MTRDVALIKSRRADQISTRFSHEHAIMDALASSVEVAAQAVNVRAELKVWEKAFASSNGGKKAGRDDIKQNAEIGRSSPGITGRCSFTSHKN